MSSYAKVFWRGDQARDDAHNAGLDTIKNAALAIGAQTKVNIRNQPTGDHIGLIDTGFMVNSVYEVVEGKLDTYGQTDKSGLYKNRQGSRVKRKIASRAHVPRDAVGLVAIGAEYAIWQEEEYHMLFRAGEVVSRKMGGLVRRV